MFFDGIGKWRRNATPKVFFRFAKERPFAERKATLASQSGVGQGTASSRPIERLLSRRYSNNNTRATLSGSFRYFLSPRRTRRFSVRSICTTTPSCTMTFTVP